jgi:hypothetical protein
LSTFHSEQAAAEFKVQCNKLFRAVYFMNENQRAEREQQKQKEIEQANVDGNSTN